MTRTTQRESRLSQPEAIAYRDGIKRLVRRAKAYGKRKKLTPAQVSKRLFGHIGRIEALEKGASFLLPDTYDDACRTLDQWEAALEGEQAA